MAWGGSRHATGGPHGINEAAEMSGARFSAIYLRALVHFQRLYEAKASLFYTKSLSAMVIIVMGNARRFFLLDTMRRQECLKILNM